MRSWTAALLACLALLSGCRLDVRTVVDVDRRAGGTVTVELVPDDDLEARLVAEGVDPLRDLDVAATPGWTATPLPDGGVRLRARVAPGELRARLDALQAGLDDETGRLLEGLDAMQLPDGRIEVTGRVGLQPPGVVGLSGPGAPTTEDLLAAVARDPDAYRYVVEVRGPADVVAGDPDRVDGDVATWTVPLGEQADVRVVFATPPAALPGGVPVAVGAAVLVALTAALVLWVRRRSPSARPRRLTGGG